VKWKICCGSIPRKSLNEPLKQFQRQPASTVGRADLIFVDRIGRLIVVELKRDTLERGAIAQLVDYFGMLKSRFPDKAVELMIVANRIPQERRLACAQFDIDAVEIPQKKFRDVAEEVGYIFKSEAGDASAPVSVPLLPTAEPKRSFVNVVEDFPRSPSKVEKGWYYWEGKNGRGYFLAFVNAKGSCSIRRFELEGGAFVGVDRRSGDYQETFSDYLKTAVPLYVSRQPNLERDCRNRLPSYVLAELRD
jgi:hypothetical protein